MLQFEFEVCKYLNIPNVPKKEWDGKSSFKDGVAVTQLAHGYFAYAICTYDAEKDEKPYVKKSFSIEPFYNISKIFVVPSYMDTDIENADLDEESKKAAAELVKEAEELTHNEEDVKVPQNPWCFDEIHNLEEARAWLANYNSKNKIKGKLPKNEESVKLRLLAIYSEQKKKNK